MAAECAPVNGWTETMQFTACSHAATNSEMPCHKPTFGWHDSLPDKRQEDPRKPPSAPRISFCEFPGEPVAVRRTPGPPVAGRWEALRSGEQPEARWVSPVFSVPCSHGYALFTRKMVRSAKGSVRNSLRVTRQE